MLRNGHQSGVFCVWNPEEPKERHGNKHAAPHATTLGGKTRSFGVCRSCSNESGHISRLCFQRFQQKQQLAISVSERLRCCIQQPELACKQPGLLNTEGSFHLLAQTFAVQSAKAPSPSRHAALGLSSLCLITCTVRTTNQNHKGGPAGRNNSQTCI